ncbi:MAG: hypothetical protein WC370_03805 [Dehalococcoidales bacterium]|jgi:hypothetical protein
MKYLAFLGILLSLVIGFSACAVGAAPPPTGGYGTYVSKNYGVRVQLPGGWAVSEGPESLMMKGETGLVSFNSWGDTGFWARAVTETASGGSFSWEFSPGVVASQIPRGGAYVALVLAASGPPSSTTTTPPGVTPPDLSGLYESHDWRQETTAYFKSFTVGESQFILIIACSKNAADATVDQVNALLQSWQFNAPLTDIAVSAAAPSGERPVEVVCVARDYKPGELVNPGGPKVVIILRNTGREPIVSLLANLDLQQGRIYNFTFDDVSDSHPLLTDKNASKTQTLIGGGISSGLVYPLEIAATLQSGETCIYTEQVMVADAQPAETPPPPTPMVSLILDGVTVTIEPGPGSYFQNSAGELYGVALMDVSLAMGVCEQDYFSPWTTSNAFKAGDACIILSGSVLNTDKERPELNLWAEGYDADGQQVSWTLDASNLVGRINIRVEYNQTGGFVIHLSPDAGLRTIRIFLVSYEFPPP